MEQELKTRVYLDKVRKTEAGKNLSNRLSFLDQEKTKPIPLKQYAGSEPQQADLWQKLVKNTGNSLEKARAAFSSILARRRQLARNQAVSVNEIDLTEAVQNDILHTDVNKKVRQ